MGVWNTKHVKNVIARAITCSMLLVSSSCAIPDLRLAQSAPELPAEFVGVASATDSENSGDLGIEEFFTDPLLVRLIHQAVQGNRELKILDEEVQIASNEILARQGAYLPFITASATAGLEKPSRFTPLGAAEEQLEYLPGKHFPDPLPNFMGAFNLFWQLDPWRELRNARDAANQRYFAATERRNAFVTRLVAEVAENYYHLVALDKRIETLGITIELQERSLRIAQAKMRAGRDTALAVQRFQAEVRKNQSETLILKQELVEAENRINFGLNRYRQPIERMSEGFLDQNIHLLNAGVPTELLHNRPDIRQAEREVAAAGLDVLVARARFFPRFDISASVGLQAFNLRYLFVTPDALVYNLAGNMVAPLINKKAIQAEYCSANARQLQSIYNYQRVTLTAFTEVLNRMSMVENYGRSIEIKKQQLEALQASVDTATKLFQSARAEYVDVLLAQRDLMDARMVVIETKRQQLSAIVRAYQALGGGDPMSHSDRDTPAQPPPEPSR